MDDIYRVGGATDVPPAVSWSDVKVALGQRRPALFIDYDGTLTPIAPRPDLAILSDDVRRLLVHLADLMPVTIVTGRDIGDAKERVGLEDLIYVGSHGFDIEGPGIVGRPEAASDETRTLIARVGQEVSREFADVPDLILEIKRFSAAIHYRQVPEDRIAPMLARVNEIAAREPGLCVTEGKKLVELRPIVDWHKGTALFWVLRTLSLDHDGVVPMFLGDDVTDEDAFRSLRRADKGYGIVVCDPPRPSFAHGRLPDTDAVRALLEQIVVWAERQ